MNRENMSSPLLFILCLSSLIHTLGDCDDSRLESPVCLSGRCFVQYAHGTDVWFTINPAFIGHVNASLFLPVMHCWLQPDAINSLSLALKDVVNHNGYSGKQLKNGTPENSEGKTQRMCSFNAKSYVHFNGRFPRCTGALKERWQEGG